MAENEQDNIPVKQDGKTEETEVNAESSAESGAAETTVNPAADIGKQKKKNRWGLIFTLVIFAFVVYALVKLSATIQEGNTSSLRDLIKDMNGWYLLAAAGVTLVVWLCDTLKYTVLNRTFGCKIGFWRDMKLGLTGKYYECITPTGTGGQPMQIYYLHKQGVPGGKGTSVVMMKYTVQMLAAALVGVIVMCVWGKTLYDVITDGTVVNGVFFAGWVGFGINAFAPVFVIFVIFCPKFLKWIINLGLVLLHKMHIIKKLDERREKIYKGIDDFSVCSQFIFSHPLKFLELFVLCVVEPICGCIIPYFIIMAFCGGKVADMNNLVMTVAAMATFSTYASSFIPTPGTSGAAESVFMLTFAVLGKDAIFWVTLVWRFFLYYVYIVLGIGMNIIDLISGIVRSRKEKQAALREGGAEAPPDDGGGGGNE